MAEGRVLIHVWELDPAEVFSHIQRFEELFAGQIPTDSGFGSRLRVRIRKDPQER